MENQSNLELDPNIGLSKDTDQSNSSITEEYNSDIYSDGSEHDLYDYKSIENGLYQDGNNSDIKLTDQDIGTLYTSPVEYKPQTENITDQLRGIIIFILVIEILIILFYVYKITYKIITKRKRRKHVANFQD